MKRFPPLLSVTTGPDGDLVTLHGDQAGLELLRDRLTALLDRLAAGECDHAHLRSPDWAGFELTTTMLDGERHQGHSPVHHLEVFAWTSEWRSKHGL